MGVGRPLSLDRPSLFQKIEIVKCLPSLSLSLVLGFSKSWNDTSNFKNDKGVFLKWACGDILWWTFFLGFPQSVFCPLSRSAFLFSSCESSYSGKINTTSFIRNREMVYA